MKKWQLGDASAFNRAAFQNDVPRQPHEITVGMRLSVEKPDVHQESGHSNQ